MDANSSGPITSTHHAALTGAYWLDSSVHRADASPRRLPAAAAPARAVALPGTWYAIAALACLTVLAALLCTTFSR
ncbi:hypothetical protein OG453_31525 [Streptomyces sp. NBC_01381]|uniref:hypothetical protein n=1 Tax=Streptomyces sp. NBC_01381 TaxID=2903845 RepID=UPI002253C06E|nr:hypothetical protein [Streptomyces sp. NBC_01381]MCX4671165.1 hypothetical protein [Streptomyces sp. NBC_01381]